MGCYYCYDCLANACLSNQILIWLEYNNDQYFFFSTIITKTLHALWIFCCYFLKSNGHARCLVLWIRHEVICIWIGLVLFIYLLGYFWGARLIWMAVERQSGEHDKYFRQDVIMISALLSTGLLNHFWGWNVGTEREFFICCLGERSILVISATLWTQCVCVFQYLFQQILCLMLNPFVLQVQRNILRPCKGNPVCSRVI